ncbi:MAG: VOC family protein [Elusimicrobia bacterium]|nr:VOC family protein [Elusimicrobiota bacterium]
MKVHLSFETCDLAASTKFYSTLLSAVPEKQLADYILFITENPPMELVLNPTPARARAASGEHFGLAVGTQEVVEAQIARLQAAGYATEIEREETCCYANQMKVWATDPDGRRWETYVVQEETETRDGASGASCCGDNEGANAITGTTV